MKRIALILIAVAALAMFVTPSANAADSSYWHGSHHGYVDHGYVSHGFVGHAYAVPSFVHGFVQHGYVAPAHGGHGYFRSYGHGGGLRISTPHFGLRFGH